MRALRKELDGARQRRFLQPGCPSALRHTRAHSHAPPAPAAEAKSVASEASTEARSGVQAVVDTAKVPPRWAPLHPPSARLPPALSPP